jgi:hypothetical protein
LIFIDCWRQLINYKNMPMGAAQMVTWCYQFPVLDISTLYNTSACKSNQDTSKFCKWYCNLVIKNLHAEYTVFINQYQPKNITCIHTMKNNFLKNPRYCLIKKRVQSRQVCDMLILLQNLINLEWIFFCNCVKLATLYENLNICLT